MLITLDTITESSRNAWQTIWNNFKKIVRVLNGNIETDNLHPSLTLDVSQVEGAIGTTGDQTITGDLTVEGKINGVDINKLQQVADYVEQNFTMIEFAEREWVISRNISAGGSDTFEESYVFEPPEGFDGRDAIVYWGITHISLDSNTDTIYITSNVDQKVGSVEVKISGEISASASGATTVNIEGEVKVIYIKRGINV